MKRHFYLIDILRFVAALMVCGYHIAFLPWAMPAGGVAIGPPPASLFWPGWVGVEIFFVISGFVISYSAIGTPTGRFLRGRVLRLYPTAWIVATVSFALMLARFGYGGSATVRTYLNSLLLNPRGPWLDYVYWTLGVEIVFYALVTLWTAQRRFGLLTLALLLTAWSGAFAFYLAARDLGGLGLPHLPFFVERLSLLRHGIFFALGMLIFEARAGVRGPAAATALAAATVAGAIEILVKTRETLGLFIASVQAVGGSLQMVWPLLLWLSAVALIVVDTRAAPRFSKWEKVLRLIGLMTYPLYLIHQQVGGAVLDSLRAGGVADGVAGAAGCLAALLAALLVARWAEPPLRRMLAAAIDGITARTRCAARA